jgi:acetyl esterase/lipase
MRNAVLPLVVLLAGVLATALFAPGLVRETSAGDDAVEFHRDVVFGKGGETDLCLDYARPAARAKPLPAVLVFHGGGWVHGKKERHDKLVRYLAGQGYFAATVQYRLAVPLRGVNPWPAQIEDAKCAVRWVRAHAGDLGVDPERIAAMGFSSGAHLAMLLGTMGPEDGLEGAGGWSEHSSKVKAVVSFFGPTDMGRYTRDPDVIRDLPFEEKKRLARGVALAAVLGPEFRKDPSRASPLRYVTEDDAAMLLVQGTRDRLVPYSDAKLMLDALDEAGVPGEVIFKIGLGHGWRDPQITASIEQTMLFLDRRLRPGHRPSLSAYVR